MIEDYAIWDTFLGFDTHTPPILLSLESPLSP